MQTRGGALVNKFKKGETPIVFESNQIWFIGKPPVPLKKEKGNEN